MSDNAIPPRWFMDSLFKKAKEEASEEKEEPKKPLPRAAQAYLDSLKVEDDKPV